MQDKNGIIDVDIEKQMKDSYLDYAMSVIVARALPDVRDGLKPVHRRIIYGMNDLNLRPGKPHRKSAALVGDVMGKYHPHGDTAIYDAVVRLAQDFNTRYPLADGQGNFGSIDGDSAAAMRYTEVRMTKLTEEMLRDIDKDTVDFIPNYDNSIEEPLVLPSRFPNLLVNGSTGIAVGMATNMAPHNLNEIIDGIVAYMEDPDIDVKGLMKYIKGPDFPTGAYIMGTKDIVKAYKTGRGKIKIRAIADIERMTKTKERIVVTEIPYQVNKAKLIIKIADLVKDKKIEGISDIRDESDRRGMRIVIELKRDANAEVVLNNLYKYTQMQSTFGIINLALVNNQPKVLSLKELISHYVSFQEEVVTRRTQYDLDKAQKRAHVVEGLRIAIANIDEIIKIIRSNYSLDDTKKIFLEKYGLTDVQSQAILDMQLKRLSGLEIEKLEAEYKELMEKIKRFKLILSDEKVLLDLIKEELLEIKKKYGDERRTEIKKDARQIKNIELIEDEEVLITLTRDGYIKRQSVDNYKVQARGGKGITAMSTKEGDYVSSMIISSTHDKIFFFTEKGRVYSLYSYQIPEGGRQAKGRAVINLIDLEPDENIKSIISVPDDEEAKEIVFATKKGMVKKTKVGEYQNIRRSGIRAIKMDEDDSLVKVRLVEDEKEIMMVTELGKAIRFDLDEVRNMGRTARGVIGIRLDEEDQLASLELIRPTDQYLLVISEMGYGKKTLLDHYNKQKRAGRGVRTLKITKRNGKVIGGRVCSAEDDIIAISKNSDIIRLRVKDISTQLRATSGVKIKDVKGENRIVAISKIIAEKEER